jgi:hypothetical protein
VKRIIFVVSLVISGIVLASAQSVEWRLAGFVDGNPDRAIRATIERNGATTMVRCFDGDRAVSESVLDENGNPFSYRTFAADGATSFEATVGDGRRIAARSGGREWIMRSQNPIVLSDPSNFWVFSLWLSHEPGFKEKSFSLYQESANRLVGMRLRNCGIEAITVGEKIIRAYRLDMSLSDPLARMFWPHVYRYWFSTEDFRFLAYEGRMADDRISRTENNPAN